MTRILIALFLMFTATPVWADTAITQAGADALKKQAVEVLAYHAASLKSAGMTLVQQGDVVVEPAQSYYAVTSPNLIIKMPNGLTRTIGMVAINAIPTDKPDVFKMAVALPTPIIDTNAAGETVGTINIGQQSMSGLYHFTVHNFVELNGTYKDITVLQPNGVQAIIPELVTQTKLTDQGSGLWSGPSVTTIKGGSYKDPKGEYTIDNVQIKANFDGLDLLAANVFRAQMQKALMTSDKNAAAGNIESLFGDYMGRFANGADIAVISTGTKYKTVTPGMPDVNSSVASSSITASLKNLKSDKASLSWNGAATGIQTNDPAMQKFTPTQMTIRANATDVPYKSIMAKSNGVAPNMADVLKNSAAKLVIDQLNVDAPSFGLDSTANLSSSKQAPLGVVGNMNLSVRGIDDLLKWMTDPNGAQKMGIPAIPQQAMAMVSIVQMTGKPGTDAQGRPVYGYDLKMAPDGSVTMNGSVIMAPTPATPKP